MTVSEEYKLLLQTLLVNGYESNYESNYYYQKQTVNFSFPAEIMMIAKQDGVPQATALAKIESIVENEGELSITYVATFSTDFNADEIDLYAVIGNTIIYKIAFVTGNFKSSTDDNLSVEWIIDITVNSVFGVGNNNMMKYTLPYGSCPSLIGQLIIYPYLVHLIIAYTLIPSLTFIVQSQFPNIPLAIMSATVPTPSSPQQLKGITAFIYACNGQPQLCYPIYNGTGIAIITQNMECSQPAIIVLYQINNTYLAFMQLQLQTTLNVGNVYSYQIGIDVS